MIVDRAESLVIEIKGLEEEEEEEKIVGNTTTSKIKTEAKSEKQQQQRGKEMISFNKIAYGLDNLNLTLSEAFEHAVKMARSQEKAVVMYSEQLSYKQPYSICAIASNKCEIEYYGSKLDKLQKDLKINTETTDGYYRLIDEARRLN